MHRLAGLFVVAAAVVAAAWWWLGRPQALPAAAGDPGRIQCMSYTPFRGGETPLDRTTQASNERIADDLGRLAAVTGCIRTYATDNGLDQVPAIAERVGIKVLQGVWLGRDRNKNRNQIDTAIDLARRFPGTITAIVVGNEVLLRGELAAADIAAALREVRTATGKPVTYADVWEFWLRHPELAAAVDFVTVHILPYWEDIPVAADRAAAHVEEIRAKVAATFPGKEILIGEVGWPSAGRMREGALPSRSNEARVLEEVMARAQANNWRVNVIEAFDQPWKRVLEGTVGGYWGLFGSSLRDPKFAWGQPVSDHPWWPAQLALGIAMAALVFAVAAAAGGGKRGPAAAGIATIALTAGVMAPWSLENVIVESLGPGGFVRGAAFAAAALAVPVAAALALAAGASVPLFEEILDPRTLRRQRWIARFAGFAVVVTTVLAVQTALGLVFDPRYHDFTDAQLSGLVIPLAVTIMLDGGRRARRPRTGRCGRTETLAAVTLAAAAVYVAINEGPANWQALWFAAVVSVLAVTLGRQIPARDAQSTA